MELRHSEGLCKLAEAMTGSVQGLREMEEPGDDSLDSSQDDQRFG